MVTSVMLRDRGIVCLEDSFSGVQQMVHPHGSQTPGSLPGFALLAGRDAPLSHRYSQLLALHPCARPSVFSFFISRLFSVRCYSESDRPASTTTRMRQRHTITISPATMVTLHTVLRASTRCHCHPATVTPCLPTFAPSPPARIHASRPVGGGLRMLGAPHRRPGRHTALRFIFLEERRRPTKCGGEQGSSAARSRTVLIIGGDVSPPPPH